MQALDRVPLGVWLLIGAAVAVLLWLLFRPEAAAGGGVVLPLIQRKLAQAKRLREEADALEVDAPVLDEARAEGEAAVDERWGE